MSGYHGYGHNLPLDGEGASVEANESLMRQSLLVIDLYKALVLSLMIKQIIGESNLG